ncbi:MAG TPA: 30S ribosome-binding factor RbfA [Roseiarcus sp.]|jgi:ribosome-binding factor A
MSRPDQKHSGPSQRLLRVGELVRHAVADILARGEIEEPALARQTVTIPSVKMSPDLKLATISVMPLGGKNIEKIIGALDRNKKALRALIAHRVNLKYAPEVRFVVDESFAAQARIDALLKSPEVARDLQHGDEDLK